MEKNILLKFDKFDINLDYCESLSYSKLYNLYLPILGTTSLFLYEYFYNSKNSTNSINNLLDTLNIDVEQLNKILNDLESIGLIKSFIEGSSSQPKIVFVLQNLLNYEDFLTNKVLKKMLENKIGTSKICSLEEKFLKSLDCSNLISISNNIDLLDTNEKNDNYSLDFNNISDEILLKINKKVSFSNQDKKIICIYYEKNNLSLDELINIISSSLQKLKNEYFVNFEKFTQRINQLKNKEKINRNYKIFSYEQNLNNFKEVLNDYENFDSERYLSLITKSEISLEISKTIKLIKNKFDFNDSMINVILDYCLFKNLGRLEINYVYKISQTLNNLNLNNDFKKAIKYFQFISNNIKPTYQQLLNEFDESIVNLSNENIWD